MQDFFQWSSRHEDSCDTFHLDRIARLRASPMRFNVSSPRGIKTCILIASSNHRLLSVHAGRGNCLSLAVLIHGGATDHGPDWVAIAKGIGQGFDDECSDAFASAIARCPIVKSVAFAIRAEKAVRFMCERVVSRPREDH